MSVQNYTRHPSEEKDTTYNLHYPKFLLFGDSITEYSSNPYTGWRFLNQKEPPAFTLGSALVQTYSRKLQVITRGFAGYNSEEGRALLPKILEIEDTPNSKVEVITIFFGTNDAVQDDYPQHVPLERFEDNIRFLGKQALDRNIRVILVGPALHDAERAKASAQLIGKYDEIGFRSSERNREYADVVKKVAEDLNVGFIDLHEEFSRLGNTNELLSDGIHFRGEGYEVFYDGIMKQIETKYPEILPKNLKIISPWWQKLPDSKTFAANVNQAN